MAHDATSCNGTPPPHQTPRIEPEGPDDIRVGGGGKLSVPHEDFGDDLDDGTEMDLVSGQPLKVRRPHRREWFHLKRDSKLCTRLLVHKPNGDGIEEQYYYIDKPLRGPILAEVRDVVIHVYYSLATKNFGLWVVKVTPGNSWYESLHQLFRQPDAFFAENAIRVASDRDAARYRVKSKPSPVTSVAWPAKTTDELLGEALGEDHFIRSSKHPVYRDLLEGSELS
jgi:hypothetical protein